MTWLTDHWLDALGWGGSALLVYSLLQSRVLRFRVLNLTASLILTVFNALIGVWPMVGMNAVIAAINFWFIAGLIRDRHREDAFEILEVRPDDTYLRHVLAVHRRDIERFNPGFAWDASRPGADAFLVERGDETVGVVLWYAEEGVADIVLDYVTPRYRDFSPGEFLWRRSGLLREHGIRRVRTPAGMLEAYYGKVGFRRDGASWVLDLTS